MRGTEARYRRFPAPAGVQAYVEHLWMVEAPGRPEPQQAILIPTGRPVVVVCLAVPGLRRDPLTGAERTNGSVVFGITTRPYVLEQLGPSSYVGAQLTPWGLAAAFPRERLVDRFLPLEDWLGSSATGELVARLRAQPFGPRRARVLGTLLRNRIIPVQPHALRLLRSAVATVDKTRGQVTVTGLAADLGVSASTLYRLCRGYLGVGPKQLCEITRYYYFVGGLLGDPGVDSDALLAGLHGYYDQAHAARSFKRYTGVSASSFKQINHGIARLMHSE